ncbi:endospore germination permease [Wukongibacter baidiensis]|uniref:GerAB/ArcD/ProY family transporter n=1 Tax=Wukongibacter baidiensis TaxID=1723361 RepID=UPI003D7FC0FB
MSREVISDKQAISLVIIFIAGTNAIMLTATSAKKDIWIAIIIAILLSMVMAFVFGRLHYLFPNKDWLEISEICFGRFLGKIINIVIVLFLFESTAQILRNTTQFTVEVSYFKTPRVIVDIVIIIICIWIVKAGIEVMGRWSEFFILPFTIAPLIVMILLINRMNINNILPILENGLSPVIHGAFEAVMFPFTQSIAFLMLIPSFSEKKSAFKVFTVGFLIGGGLLLLLVLPTILILGINESSELFYPTYAAVSRLEIADFIQRLEIIVGALFMLGAFIKVSIFLIATCKGVSKILKFIDYRFIVTPIGLLIVNLVYFEFDNIMEYFIFGTGVWYYYVIPFQLGIPIILWITAEIKVRSQRIDKLNQI